ncbi:hypothetical protein GCM10027074_15920 [Streptomyces deserti]
MPGRLGWPLWLAAWRWAASHGILSPVSPVACRLSPVARPCRQSGRSAVGSRSVVGRFHLDIRVPGHGSPDERWARIRAEAGRLVRAGGTVLVEFDGHHVVMADPEGNEFCVGAAAT